MLDRIKLRHLLNRGQEMLAVAVGLTVDVQGEMLDLKLTVNSMVNQLNTLANEVSRVLLEVGTEGILGGQALSQTSKECGRFLLITSTL